jgi:alcohol dehydrogenase class IV
MVNTFGFSATPDIIFGSGKLNMVPKLPEPFGNSILLITGKQSFIQSEHWDKLLLRFETARVRWKHFMVETEPTPAMIDRCVREFSDVPIDVVIAIGGGSVMDAGKAISAMLCQEGQVKDYLEGVGTKRPTGKKIPFIAVPTTSGTGSEATKNAVISEVGPNGFKKSLRHDRFVPDIALIDPALTVNCPKEVTAQSGMDAFTQLLESYVSANANPMTDALAVDGIRKIRDGLEMAVDQGENLAAREMMAYASMLSGITLANAGLGTVHGFASSIGGFFNIPHGLVCARMMEPVNRLTIDKLKKISPDDPGLYKYARIGKLFSKDKNRSDSDYIAILMDRINEWTEKFDLKRLSDFGVTKRDFERIIAETGNKYNPAKLDGDELHQALSLAL